MNDGVFNDGALTGADTLAGRYRVIEAIGSGGMARVYLAHDAALGRRVAVKVLRSDVADGATADRAAVETHLLASLNHPGLVTLFDAHLAHEPRFLVMEHVVGTTLAARIADGPLGTRELTALGSQLADALHVVHDAGIVHRDVKPSNILLARSTAPGVPLRAKLADFGIAHLLDGERVTSPSLLVGTAAYIAPELLHGADPAPPSDIYALGLVLLEAASGTRAFAGAEGNRGQLLARLSRDPEMPAALDHRWRELMCAMTAREPADRPTAREVMAQLTVGGGAMGVDSPATARSEQHRRAALAGVATAAWPVTRPAAALPPEAATPPGSATGEPVSASAAGMPVPARTAPTLVASTLTAAAASVPERITADRRRRRERRRLALATGATAAAGVAAVIAASVLLWQPDVTPTTDPVETPAVQTPGVTPATEAVVTDTTADVDEPAQQQATVDEAPPAGNTAEPAVGETDAGGDDPAVDGGAGNGAGSGNGNGPGSNSGNGNGNDPGSNSGNGNGNGRGSGKPAPGDR